MSDHKILSFQQGAAFYFAKYRRHVEQRQYAEALQALRTACEKQPDDTEYAMELAQLYTEMDFFLESNMILLHIFPKHPDYQEECLYGMGCNFFGLQDIPKAKECFEKILDYYPNGVYSADAAEFLEYLNEEVLGASPLTPQEIQEADKGKTAIDNGQAEQAIEIFAGLCEKYPDELFLKNNLALAHYCCGQADRAIELSRQVVLKDRRSPHGICNLLLFAMGAQQEALVEQYRPLLDKADCCEPEEALKVALTYCELGEEQKAFPLFQRALEDIPYDYQALYFAAACANNIGEAGKAESYLSEMAKLWADDSVTEYYLREIRRCRKEGGSLRMPYNCQVPEQEIHKRLIYLNDKFMLPDAQLQEAWLQEEALYGLILWGMDAGGDTARRMIVSVLGRIGDAKAEALLRKWLLRRYENDEIKNLILFALHRMDAAQPYVAYLSGKITEVRMGETAVEVPESYDAILEHMIQLMEKLSCKQYLPNAVGIFSEFLKQFAYPPRLRRYRIWAAAFVMLCLRKYTIDIPLWQVSEEADVSEQGILRALRSIAHQLPEYKQYAK